MKKVFLFFVLFISLVGYSQNGISYQALILNPSGEELPGVNNPNAPLSNKLICLKFSIIDSNSSIEYLETHKVTTDAHGIVNLIIGTGDQIGGYASSFDNIVWNNTPKNLKVDLDVRANCTYFVEISNQPFTYVPFAYYAANANVPNATTLSTGIIQLAGDLGGTGTTATAPIISNNAITSAKILNGAVTPIKIASGANNTVLVTDATGNVAWVDRASFGVVADMTTIEGAGTIASPFRVKDLGIVTNKIADNAVTTQKIANGAITNAKIGEVITVPNGGTGASTLTGYVKGNGTAPMTAVTSIPVADVTGAQTTANLTSNISSNTGSTTLYPSVAAVEAFVANNATPDATNTVKGKLKLAGDLGGTADVPTVPALANKENTIAAGTTSQYWRGDKTWQTLDKSAVGLGNVDNTSDANKPVSTAVQTALNAKENTANKSTTTTLGTSDVLFPTQNAVKTYVDSQLAAGVIDATTTVKGKLKLAGDLGGTADAPTVPALANKENTIAAGTTSQYWRGDKTWQALDKSAVGLGNVDNTSDANKPVSTAVQTALNAKENTANKSDVTTLGTSDVLFPTQNAVKTYVDNQIVANATPDATSTVKGKLQLAGDLAGTGSSASSPVISNNAISSNKIANAAVTPAKIAPGSNDSVLVTDNSGTVVWIDKGAFGSVADLTTIEGVGTTANPFKVKDLGIITAKLANGAVTTAKLADDAVTNAKIGEIISIENGGTGSNMTATAGYVKQATTGANLSTVSTIPVTDVTGAVRSVNGVVPASDGNVAVIIGRVFTGATVNPDLATSIINASPAKQQSDIYIVADGSNPNNGRTFIYDGTNWLEVATDLSTTDARYVNVAGDTMEGNLTVPAGKKIIIADAPTGSTDAVNKAYVDGLITSSATPDATASIKGKIKLAGDLGGTADAPTVPDLALKAPLESPSLTGTPLAPTAAAGTNTTQIATTAFVTAATSGKQDAITLTTTGTGAASLVGSTLNIPTPNNGTVTEISALTIGTSGTDITSTVANATTTPVVTLNVPTASAANRGALSAADWTTFNNKIGGSGTTNFVPKFTGSSTIGDSSIFDDGTKVGIGTASPANTLEIKQGTAGNSGLRLTNLTASSNATTTSNKVLGVDSNGDVILTNVPGTQNIVSFSTATPTTSGVVFTPNTPTDQSVVYQSIVDNSLWTYNGTAYVTYTAPASTAWNLANTNNDAGSNKTSTIYRTGNVAIGTNNPTGNFEVNGSSTQTMVNILNSNASGRVLTKFKAATGGDFDFRVYSNGYSETLFGQSMSGKATWMGFSDLLLGTLTTNPIIFGTNGIERMRILSDGRIGIGTTSPSTTLHVNNTLLATNSVNVDAQVLRLTRPQTTNQKWDNIAQFNLGSYSNSTVSATSRLDLALSDGAGTTTSNVMTWQANGSVGIGTTAPVNNLDVVGGFNLRNVAGAAGSNYGIEFNTNSNAPRIDWVFNGGYIGQFTSDANDFQLRNSKQATGGFRFFTNPLGTAIERMAILNNGNVGIGTSAPISLFSNAPTGSNFVGSNSAIQSTTGISWLTNTTGYNTSLYNANNVAGSNGLQVKVANNSSQTFALEIGQNTSQTGISTPLFNVTGNGFVGVGTNSPVSTFSNTSTAIQGSNTTNAFNGGLTWSSPGTGFVGSFYSQPSNGNGLQIKIAGNTSSNNALEVSSGATQTGSLTPLFNVLGNGNVGVGTNAPLTRLIVNDNTYIANIPTTTTNLMDNSTFRPLTRFQATSGINNNAISHYLTTTVAATQAHNYSTGVTLPYVLQPAGGNVGIGTTAPAAQLHTTGSVRFAGAGTPAAGRVLTSDASGNATWQPVNFAPAVQNRTADFTLTAADSGSVIVVNSATTVTVTIPSTLSAGYYCQIIQQGAGQVNVVGSGVSVTSALGTFSRTTGSSIGIMLTSSTAAFLSGDTAF